MPAVHLVNPSTQSFGVAVITPRWLYVLAAATGSRWGDPQIVDETIEAINFDAVSAGDVVGIGIHTGNALRGYDGRGRGHVDAIAQLDDACLGVRQGKLAITRRKESNN